MAGYKPDIQISTVFLFTSNKILKIDILSTVYDRLKKLKILKLNLRKKDGQEHYMENYKTLWREILNM